MKENNVEMYVATQQRNHQLWDSIPLAYCNTFPSNTTNVHNPFPGFFFSISKREFQRQFIWLGSLHNNAQFIYAHFEIDGNNISEIQLLFASNMVVGGAKRCLATVSFSTNAMVIYQDLSTGF